MIIIINVSIGIIPSPTLPLLLLHPCLYSCLRLFVDKGRGCAPRASECEIPLAKSTGKVQCYNVARPPLTFPPPHLPLPRAPRSSFSNERLPLVPARLIATLRDNFLNISYIYLYIYIYIYSSITLASNSLVIGQGWMKIC